MNKIGWCDLTWNPVWGCLNNCEYCYARNIAKRFGKQTAQNIFNYRFKKRLEVSLRYYKEDENNLINFIPQWVLPHFDKPFPKKPSRIFIGSMSEISYWKPEWMESVLDRIKKHPRHTFIFLTKDNDVYSEYDFPKNCWLGYTVTTNFEYRNKSRFAYSFNNNLVFFSIEPILKEINLIDNHWINWVIVGAETGNRKGKVVPKKKWILKIREYCKINDIPLYEKKSLEPIMGKLIQEWPK